MVIDLDWLWADPVMLGRPLTRLACSCSPCGLAGPCCPCCCFCASVCCCSQERALFVLEALENGNLFDVVQYSGPLDEALACHFFKQALAGVYWLSFQRLVVHQCLR
jgi:hypothetical protein